MSKFVRNYRIRNGVSLALMVFFVSIVVIFWNTFVETMSQSFEAGIGDKTLFIMFFCCVCIAVGIMLFFFIRDTFKSKDKIIKEKKDLLTNRIKYYKKYISELESEVSKLE